MIFLHIKDQKLLTIYIVCDIILIVREISLNTIRKENDMRWKHRKKRTKKIELTFEINIHFLKFSLKWTVEL